MGGQVSPDKAAEWIGKAESAGASKIIYATPSGAAIPKSTSAVFEAMRQYGSTIEIVEIPFR